MGRKIDKTHRLWLYERGIELMEKYPKMTKKAIAERLQISPRKFNQILLEDGRTFKRG